MKTPSTNSRPAADLKRQDPQEALGLENQTSLVRALLEAVVACVVLVAIFTVGPATYAHFLGKKDNTADAKPAKSDEQPKDKKPTEPKQASTPAKPKTDSTASTGQPPIDKGALDKLGIGDTKTGTPSFNPLDKNDDDILGEINKKN